MRCRFFPVASMAIVLLLAGCAENAFTSKPVSQDEFAKMLAGEWRQDNGPKAFEDDLVRRPDGSYPVHETHRRWSFVYKPTKQVHGTFAYEATVIIDGNKSEDQGSGTWTLSNLRSVAERLKNGALVYEAELLKSNKQPEPPSSDPEVNRGNSLLRMLDKTYKFELKDDELVIFKASQNPFSKWQVEAVLHRQ